MWEKVARTAKPLRRPGFQAGKFPATDKKSHAAEPKAKSQSAATAPSTVPKTRYRHEPTPIDRRTARRIARGSIVLDARIDLHGDHQSEAFERLYRFLAATQADGGRLVLVITGKGGPGYGDRGVLRRSVPHWLASARFRLLVSGFAQAHRAHGGTGAFYVRIRRIVG